MILNKRRATLLCVLGLALTPCAKVSPSPASVAGNWSGTFSACSNQWNCSFAFQLQQNGASLSGSWNASNNANIAGNVTGSVSSSTASIILVPRSSDFCGYQINATLTNPTTMTGSFYATFCSLSQGTNGAFSATKQ